MTVDEVLRWLKTKRTRKTLEEMSSRYGIPNDHAFGVPMGEMVKFTKPLARDHALAQELWGTRWYEARTIACLIDEADQVTRRQMDQWAADFDSWAICDTACFRLFDRTRFAWEKVPKWIGSRKEFVRRAGFALIWSLSVHDKEASNKQFKDALKLIETSKPDDRSLVKKAVDMALRAVGKRNATLNKAAISTAKRLGRSDNKTQAWIGKKALRELESEKIQQALKQQNYQRTN